jgi:RNA polymerase sigma-70 factor (ECF subfamily)
MATTPIDGGSVRTDAREALVALYDQTFSRVYNAIRYRVEDDATAEELTAQVYERVLRSFDNYQPTVGPLEAWLFGIVRHLVSNHLRRRRIIAWLPWESVWHRPGPDPHPEEVTIQRELEARLAQALPLLKDRERELLGLKYGAGLTNGRIADLTGLSEQNVGVILHRAVRRLRKMMGEDFTRVPPPCSEEEVAHV